MDAPAIPPPPRGLQVILHDPPSFSLGEPLFSEAFYGELLRILAPGGLLYHYVGDPSSKLGLHLLPVLLCRVTCVTCGISDIKIEHLALCAGPNT